MEETEQDYNHVIEALTNAFGNVLSRDVFIAVIENCGGDLEQSANAVMNIIIEGNSLSPNGPQNIDDCLNESEQSRQSAASVSTIQDNVPTNSTVTSYASASQSSIPTLQLIPKSTMPSTDIVWTTQLRQISQHHKNGARTLIIMRGAPGSGKSHLAKRLLNDMLGPELEKIYDIHVLSTDDYFMHRGGYVYNKYRLSEAHDWNRNRATQAMRQGISPVIIDNTNIQYFEMEGYVREGVKNGYIIEVVEPNTAWAKKATQLSKRNSHDVPKHTIRKMLEKYENGITGKLLMKKFNCYYTHQMLPPVLRNIPPIPQKSHQEVSSSTDDGEQCKDINTNSVKVKQATEVKTLPNTLLMEAITVKNQESNTLCDEEVDSDQKIRNKNYKFIETQRCLEEMEKVGIEWDNGDGWDDSRNNISEKYDGKILPESEPSSKPQRRNKSPRYRRIKKYQDWNIISELPPWDDKNSVPVVEKVTPFLEKSTSYTCIEQSDLLNLDNTLKIITSTPRNINELYVPLKTNKMPEKMLLDKSTSTSNNEILTNNHRCPNEEQHFIALRNRFKNIAEKDLRHIFDDCYGDVNWAAEIVLDGTKKKEFGLIENEDTTLVSENEVETQNGKECQCLAAYGIQPYICEQSKCTVVSENGSSVSSYHLKKVKKETVVSEASKELKRQIEQNFVIPSSHNSQQSLKIRNFQTGDDEKFITTEHIRTKNLEDRLVVNELQSTSQYQDSQKDCYMPSTSKSDNNEISDKDLYADWDDTENTVNINLGTEFIAQLDKLFGRNIEYPKNVNPRINIPMPLLNEINALWIESVMYQLEEDDKQSELMIQQDEEFARELALKEAESSRSGQEPGVPDFKEIMDMDFALSLYHKEIDERLNNIPGNMAENLSRKKLYNLFPHLPPNKLSGLLADNKENFQKTVEKILASSGKVEMITGQNGISKFIMKRELERHQEKLLEEEQKTLSEVDWPLLPKWEKGQMAMVVQYRKASEKHLQERNLNYQRAQLCIRHGLTDIASFYSKLARVHKAKYEQANSLAAASLMHVSASINNENATIDLHYLRVSEAIESVDLFLDTHIQKLKDMQDNNIVKQHRLYFITGRGLHSGGRPRIKPAVEKRLLERGLTYSERNPGLLTAKVTANDRMSYHFS